MIALPNTKSTIFDKLKHFSFSCFSSPEFYHLLSIFLP